MLDDDRRRMEIPVNFRMFVREFEKMNKIVIHAETPEGWRKYDNTSHFCRCAIMKQVNEENTKLEVKRGRPKKYDDKK